VSCGVFSRRLLSGVSGSYAQRRPLRSQKDVRQQRPGPECVQERDHYHGESTITTFAEVRDVISQLFSSAEVFLFIAIVRDLL